MTTSDPRATPNWDERHQIQGEPGPEPDLSKINDSLIEEIRRRLARPSDMPEKPITSMTLSYDTLFLNGEPVVRGALVTGAIDAWNRRYKIAQSE